MSEKKRNRDMRTGIKKREREHQLDQTVDRSIDRS